MRRKILIISFHYPPDSAIGGHRIGRLADFLNEKDIEYQILTANHASQIKDESIPYANNKNVVRIWNPSRIKRIQDVRESSHRSPPLRSRLAKLVRRLLFPDKYLDWLVFGTIESIRLYRYHRFTHIITTSPPYSTNVIGLILSSLSQAHWVMDLRDPWSADPDLEGYYLLHRKLEGVCVNKAKAITTTTREISNLYKAIFPEQSHKIVTVSNGIDFRMVRQSRNQVNSLEGSPVRIIYAGSLNAKRTPAFLIRSLALVKKDKGISEKDLSIVLLGKCDHVDISAMIKSNNVDDLIKYEGLLSHSLALRFMADANALLLIGRSSEERGLFVPAKVFEYLAFRKPILALMREGATTTLLREVGVMTIAPPDDLKAIANLLEYVVSRAREHSLDSLAPLPSVEQLDYRAIFEKFLWAINGTKHQVVQNA